MAQRWPPYVPIKLHFARARHGQSLSRRSISYTAFFYLLFTTLLFADSISIRPRHCPPPCPLDCQSVGEFVVLKIRWLRSRSRVFFAGFVNRRELRDSVVLPERFERITGAIRMAMHEEIIIVPQSRRSCHFISRETIRKKKETTV